MDSFGSTAVIGGSLLATAVLWKVAGTLIYQHARRTTTVLDDLPQLGRPRSGPKLSETAVIAGGSIAGVMTARVLSGHFEKVLIIEPDSELEQKRTRVGQWNQLHAFLPILRLVLLRLFPDFDAEAERAGHRITPMSVSTLANLEGGDCLSDPTAIPPTLTATRMSFERLIRSLLDSHCSNVTVVAGTVTGVQATTDGKRIASVQVRKSDSTRDEIATSFFVDCSGPVCGSSQWLPRANPSWTAEKELYDPRVGYSTGYYELTPEQLARFNAKLPENRQTSAGIRQVYPSTKSKGQIGFAVMRYGINGIVLLSVQWGHVAEYPETVDSFVEFAKQCEDATTEIGRGEYFYEAMTVLQESLGEDACQAKSLVKYSVTGMHHYRFDKAPALPDNYAIMGDALLRLNPVFGQGCAKAGQDITTLDAVLRKVTGSVIPEGFSRKLLNVQTPRARVFFDSTRSMDYRFPTTTPMQGETLEKGAFERKFSEAIIRLTHKDADAGTAFQKSLNNLEPGIMLMKPSFVFKVVWNALTSGAEKRHHTRTCCQKAA